MSTLAASALPMYPTMPHMGEVEDGVGRVERQKRQATMSLETIWPGRVVVPGQSFRAG